MNSNTVAHGRPPLGGLPASGGPQLCLEEGNQGSPCQETPSLQVFPAGFVVGAVQLVY